MGKPTREGYKTFWLVPQPLHPVHPPALLRSYPTACLSPGYLYLWSIISSCPRLPVFSSGLHHYSQGRFPRYLNWNFHASCLTTCASWIMMPTRIGIVVANNTVMWYCGFTTALFNGDSPGPNCHHSLRTTCITNLFQTNMIFRYKWLLSIESAIQSKNKINNCHLK